MSHIDSNYGQLRRERVKGILEVPQLNKPAGETGYRPDTPHVSGVTEFLFNNNVPESSTPYESIKREELFSEAPAVLSNLENISRYLTPGPHTAQKSTASNSNTLTRTSMHIAGHGGRGTTTSSKRGREATGKSSNQQGPAQKRPRGNRATSAVRSNNGRDAGGAGEEDEDEEEGDEEDEESEEDDGPVIHPGPKELLALPCPMPSCEGKDKLWDNWNNLIQHLQNTHIKGFSFCARGCGRRFGLSSQYSRHVFKHKKKCKPLSGPPQRIPSLALDLNHAVSRVKGQNYEKLKQVIAKHDYYDLEAPPHNTHYIDPSGHSTSSQSHHQYNSQGQQLTGWADQVIKLITEHQRTCPAYLQTNPPSSSPIQASTQLNHSPSSIANRQTPQNPIDPMMPSQLNQSAIHPPGIFSTQPPAAAYHPNFQNGSSPSLLGSHLPQDRFTPQFGQDAQGRVPVQLSHNCYQLIGDRAGQYPAPTISFTDYIRANRGAPLSELGYDPLSMPEYHLNLGASHGNGTSDATRFNRGS